MCKFESGPTKVICRITIIQLRSNGISSEKYVQGRGDELNLIIKVLLSFFSFYYCFQIKEIIEFDFFKEL